MDRKIFNLRYYKNVKKTQVEMMKDRGFTIDEDEKRFLENLTDEEFEKIFKGDVKNLEKKYEKDDCVYSIVYLQSLSLSQLSELVSEMNKKIIEDDEKRMKYILFLYEDPKPNVLAKLDLEPDFSFLNMKKMISNPTKWFLAPKIQLITDNKILEKILKLNLPKIKSEDVLIKYYGYNIGDVVKITYKNNFLKDSLLDEFPSYRVIVR